MLEAVLFDLDGTLWSSSPEICIAWNRVLDRHPELKRGPITEDELASCFGLPMTEIARKLFPELLEENKQTLMDECCIEENEYLSVHGGTLFPQLEETLAKLKEKYQLFIVSNCQSGYIECFIKAHKLEKYFDDIECWGNNNLPKGENNKLIMQRNGITKAVYVGDTSGDEESARVAGIPFIFAAYGFGEAIAPDETIYAFAELPQLLEQF